MKTKFISIAIMIAILGVFNTNAQTNNWPTTDSSACSGTNKNLIWNCGNVGIGKTEPTYNLDIDGTFRVVNDTSDLLVQESNGEFFQVNGEFSFENHNDYGFDMVGFSYVDGDEGFFACAAMDQTAFGGVKQLTYGYQDDTTNEAYFVGASATWLNLGYGGGGAPNGDNVIWIDNNGLLYIVKDQSASTLGFVINDSSHANIFGVYNDGHGFIDGDFYPLTNNAHKLGNSTNRWTEVFATNGTINTSDRRQKDNIENLKYGLKEVMDLRPVSFTWKDNKENGTKLGLIAQEVNEVLGEVVREGKTDEEVWGVYYSDIIPVLINGMQEQQAIIEEKDTEIKDLNTRLARIEAMLFDNNGNGTPDVKPINDGSNINIVPGTLGQNNPNPFGANTTISYTLDKSVTNARISVMNIDGKEMKSKNLEINTSGQVEIELEGLNSGIYFYSLIIDGNIVATKPMVKM